MNRLSVTLTSIALMALVLPAFSAEGQNPAVCTAAGAAQPVIDVHMHAMAVPPVTARAVSRVDSIAGPIPQSAEDLRTQTLNAMREMNVVRGVVSGPMTADWVKNAPAQLIPSFGFRAPPSSVDSMKALLQAGGFRAIGEVLTQYAGIAPNDPSLEPYFALAESLDLPVGIHMQGGGTPGVATFRVAMGNPLLLEDVLVKHPKLRIYIMHAGHPFIEETTALMRYYPQVYADISQIDWASPADEFYDYLRRLTRVGLANRLMFGSDGGVRPGAIKVGIQRIQNADFLTPQQKSDILCGNAARFFRLN